MKKLSLSLATLAASLTLAPAVFAADNLGTVANVTLDSCADDPSAAATITPEANAAEVNVTFSKLCLVYQEEDNSGKEDINKRPKDKAWIGFQMTAPSDIEDTTAQVTLPSGDKISYQTALDSEDNKQVASFWKGITKADLDKLTLEEGKTSYTYTFIFDWDGKPGNEDDQTVNLIINTTQITLQDTAQQEIFSPANAEKNIEDYNASQQPAETPTETPTEETTENPNTADPIALYATVAVLAVLGLGATAVLAKKFNR